MDRASLSIRVERYKDTIFIPLPPELWRTTGNECCCAWCKAHPELPSMWDTMVVSAKPPKKGATDFTSMCHYPELANPLGRAYENAGSLMSQPETVS